MTALVALVLCAVVTFIVRIIPRWRSRDFGVDSWYYLAYARAWRRQRRWPVRLDNYLLDDPSQVYPPGLPWLLSWFPTRWLERYHWSISAGVDAVHCTVLCGVVWWIVGSAAAVAMAGALFATSPVLVAQATELNARPFGGFLCTVFMLSLWVFQTHRAAGAVAIILAGMLIMWTHKMTTQQIVAVLVAWTVTERDWVYLALGVGMVALSVSLSHGWFLSVVRGHREIIEFWRRNRRYLGAHQVYQSPLYANPEKLRGRLGVTGLRGSRFHRSLALLHLVIITTLVVTIGYADLVPSAPAVHFFFKWVAVVLLTVAATAWVPGLTRFGEGFKYLRYGVFPWSGAIAVWAAESPTLLSVSLVCVTILLQVVVVRRILVAQTENFLARVDDDVRALVDELAGRPEDGVLAFPVTHSEAIAYFGEKRVLWGAHGVGWHRVQPFFPVLLHPIEFFFKEYGLNWLWIDARYVDVEDLRLSPDAIELWKSRGSIRLFRVIPQGA
jgi:hypothetical protein